jgi:hypothetical protein
MLEVLQAANQSDDPIIQGTRLVMQIHDELVYEVDKNVDLNKFSFFLKHCLETVVCRRLNIIVCPISISYGSRLKFKSLFIPNYFLLTIELHLNFLQNAEHLFLLQINSTVGVQWKNTLL